MTTETDRQVIVEAVGLTKVFKDFWLRTKARAVDHVDFQIHANEIFGLLGPNGSGKSTIIKMILGLLHRTSGRLTVYGKLPSDVSIKRHIGFLPEESYLYRFLNARETLDYYGRLFGLDRKTRTHRIDELLDMVGLTSVAHRPIGEYSKGMTRRIGIAQALINDPDFLILDEPTTGLDPIGIRQVKDLLINLRERGKTILLSSHLLADVEDVCDRMVMLYGGRIRVEGNTSDLLRDTQRTVIHTPRLAPATIDRINSLLQEEGQAIDSVQSPRQSLEHLFLEVVKQAQKEQVTTAGVSEGGGTAPFLRGEEDEPEEQGEQLIEHLVTAPSRDAPAPVVPVTDAPSSDEEDAGAAVLEELLQEPGEPGHDPSPESPLQVPDDVDAGVIDSLVKRPGEETEEDS